MAIPNEKDVGDALERLAETDHLVAELKRNVEVQSYLAKKQRYIQFLDSKGNIEERKAQAEISLDVKKHVDEYHDAIQHHEELVNERKTLALKIEVWRSLNSARKAGMNV